MPPAAATSAEQPEAATVTQGDLVRERLAQLGRVRQMWSKAQGYTYTPLDEKFVLQFRRSLLAKPEHTTAIDLVRGVRRGEKFVLFDVEEIATIVAVQRPVGSDVDIELRPKSTPPPRESADPTPVRRARPTLSYIPLAAARAATCHRRRPQRRREAGGCHSAARGAEELPRRAPGPLRGGLRL